jgi:hypothetical protein
MNLFPTLEFYRGEALLAMIGVHHGRSLRWADGTWEGDVLLTEESADHLTQWLAENNVREPLEELSEHRAQEDALQHRFERYGEILPNGLERALRRSETAEGFGSAVRSRVTDDVDRATLYFQLLGCDYGSWNLYSGLDDFIISELRDISQESVWTAIDRARTDPDGLRGAARWLIIANEPSGLDSADLDLALDQIGVVGLSHGADRGLSGKGWFSTVPCDTSPLRSRGDRSYTPPRR